VLNTVFQKHLFRLLTMRKEINTMDDPENPQPAPWWRRMPARAWWLIGAAAVFTLGWLLVRAARRGQAGSALAAVPIAAAAALATVQPVRHSRPDRDDLRGALREAAAERPLWTPTELFERLRAQGIAVTSPQRLARDLADFGLSSAVRTVDGRPERRWYDLSPMKQA
jgi:drug/metabolite transporter superfamily protein YnfA